jgi:hypothetical protein
MGECPGTPVHDWHLHAAAFRSLAYDTKCLNHETPSDDYTHRFSSDLGSVGV